MTSYPRAGRYPLAQGYASVVGVVLVTLGILGFIDNGIASSNPEAIFRVNAALNSVHIATGAIAVYVAFALNGEAQAIAIMGLGLFYVAVLLLMLAAPILLGPFRVTHGSILVLHAVLAIVTIGVGSLAWNHARAVAAR